jgi:hypothetical protein
MPHQTGQGAGLHLLRREEDPRALPNKFGVAEELALKDDPKTLPAEGAPVLFEPKRLVPDPAPAPLVAVGAKVNVGADFGVSGMMKVRISWLKKGFQKDWSRLEFRS